MTTAAVIRYDLSYVAKTMGCSSVEHPDGPFVLYADYATLNAKLAGLEARDAVMRRTLEDSKARRDLLVTYVESLIDMLPSTQHAKGGTVERVRSAIRDWQV